MGSWEECDFGLQSVSNLSRPSFKLGQVGKIHRTPRLNVRRHVQMHTETYAVSHIGIHKAGI